MSAKDSPPRLRHSGVLERKGLSDGKVQVGLFLSRRATSNVVLVGIGLHVSARVGGRDLLFCFVHADSIIARVVPLRNTCVIIKQGAGP